MDETADRHAIRALVEAYAAGVDGRRPDDVAALFTADGRLVVHRDPSAGPADPGVERVGPDGIARALRGLDRYPATVHDVASHHATIDGDAARATTTCFAHHLEAGDDGAWTDRVLAIRYDDALVRDGDAWRIARRDLWTLWVERRPVDR